MKETAIMDTLSKRKRIAELNDMCRKAMGVAGRVVQTRGVAALAPSLQAVIVNKVKLCDTFTEENDPHGEHDFGAFDHQEHQILWKIDYYAQDMENGSEDPADPKQTVRVLTIMLASEY
jgi:hypothetical protein